MTGHLTTAEAEPLVADYLRDLDAALAQLLRKDAAELRQQIVDHLNDAISPDSEKSPKATVAGVAELTVALGTSNANLRDYHRCSAQLPEQLNNTSAPPRWAS